MTAQEHPHPKDLHLAITRAWPQADGQSVENIINAASRAARPILGYKESQGHPTFQCPCANPYHHLSNDDLRKEGYQPTQTPVYGEPDPDKLMANAIEIAEAANRRYQENLDAQQDGTADALGIKPPTAWNARYDGDF